MTDQRIVYINGNSIKPISPDAKDMECGLILIQSIFGNDKQDIKQIRKNYDRNIGLSTDFFAEIFTKNGVPVIFRQIPYNLLLNILKTNEFCIVRLSTNRFFMQLGHLTYMYKNEYNIPFIFDLPSTSIPAEEYIRARDYDFNQIWVLFYHDA